MLVLLKTNHWIKDYPKMVKGKKKHNSTINMVNGENEDSDISQIGSSMISHKDE